MDYQRALEEKGFAAKEISKAVEKKRGEYGGLLSKEDALRLVAEERGIDAEPGGKAAAWTDLVSVREGEAVNVRVTVEKAYPTKEFAKGSSKSKIAKAVVTQGGATAMLVLWGKDADLAEGTLRKGRKLAVKNALAKRGLEGLELHSRLLTEVKDEGLGEPEKTALSELKEGMRGVCVTALVLNKPGGLREFERNGRKGAVCRVTVTDGTATVPLACWDSNAYASAAWLPGDRVRVEGASVRQGELQANWDAVAFREAAEPERLPKAALSKIGDGEEAVVEAKVSTLYGARTVEKNGRRVTYLNGELEDSSGKARFVAFDQAALCFLGAKESDVAVETVLELKRGYVVGKTAVLVVKGRKNELSGVVELVLEHTVSFKD